MRLNKPINIRKAQQQDLKAIQDLNYELFVHDQEYDPMLKMTWPYDVEGREYFESRIAGTDGICFVAEVAGQVIGYVCGGIMEVHTYRMIKKEVELENTLVDAEYRDQRIGEQLFHELVIWAREQRAERVMVSAAAQNAEAIRFYRRVGFEDYATELEFEIR